MSENKTIFKEPCNGGSRASARRIQRAEGRFSMSNTFLKCGRQLIFRSQTLSWAMYISIRVFPPAMLEHKNKTESDLVSPSFSWNASYSLPCLQRVEMFMKPYLTCNSNNTKNGNTSVLAVLRLQEA